MSTEERSLVVFGEFESRGRRAVAEAAEALGFAAEYVSTPAHLASRFDAGAPAALLVDMEADGAFESCLETRKREPLSQLPILGLALRRNDLRFVEAYRWGCDDLVQSGSPGGIVRRLRDLGKLAKPIPRPGPKGQVLIAGANAEWRTIMARALTTAGLTPTFAGNAVDAIEQSHNVRFVVAADDLPPNGALQTVSMARAAGSTAPWVIAAPPKRLAAVFESCVTLPSCAVVDAYAPPENALFVANETGGTHDNHRASVRLVYGTTVAFRQAGRDSDEIGFSYNVSAGGLYIRTLAPLEPGQRVWLELSAPRSDRCVRLAGRVTWRRLYGANETAIVPAGFGICVTDGLAGDVEHYRECCERLATQRQQFHNPSQIPSQLAPAIV